MGPPLRSGGGELRFVESAAGPVGGANGDADGLGELIGPPAAGRVFECKER